MNWQGNNDSLVSLGQTKPEDTKRTQAKSCSKASTLEDVLPMPSLKD